MTTSKKGMEARTKLIKNKLGEQKIKKIEAWRPKM